MAHYTVHHGLAAWMPWYSRRSDKGAEAEFQPEEEAAENIRRQLKADGHNRHAGMARWGSGDIAEKLV